jgi:hypothetical protein
LVLKVIVEVATVLPDARDGELGLQWVVIGDQSFPGGVQGELDLLALAAATVTVFDPTTTVFLLVFAEAATAITLPWRSVSSTERVSVIVHELPPEHLTATLAVVPDTLT